MLVAQHPLGGQQGGVLRQVLVVHQEVLPVHVHVDVADALGAQLVDHVQRHPHVAHQDLHRGLGVLVLEEQPHAVPLAHLGGLPDALDQPSPRVGVRGLERVVVALDAGPHDEVRAQRAGEVGGLAGEAARLLAHAGVGRHQPAAAELRIQVQAGGDAVDVVVAERRAHVVEVVGRELVGVVELVAVHQVAEALHRAVHLLGGRFRGVLGLVAHGDEAGDHRAQRPYAEAGLHWRLLLADTLVEWKARESECSVTRSWAAPTRTR